jgi:hypothetical protein
MRQRIYGGLRRFTADPPYDEDDKNNGIRLGI